MKLQNIPNRYSTVIILLVFPLIYLTTKTCSWNETYKMIRNSRSDERSNIVFLKTHKCASSTVQNILLRYGYSRNLDFVLPSGSNYLGHPKYFSKAMIPPEIKTQTNKYNIFTHHTRFNYNNIKEIMNDDAIFVTILRNPAELFESIYSYYSLELLYGEGIHELIRNPNMNKLLNLRYLDKIGINQMSYDLGLQGNYFEKREEVEKFITIIDKQFDLVMISEYIEASLVLLSNLMNWPLTKVTFLPINVRTDNRRVNISIEERQKLMNINAADTRLYNFFKNKFRNTINYYGIDKIVKKVEMLINLNTRLYTRCVKQLNEKGYANTKSYEIKNYNDWLCNYATKNELNFTIDIVNEQKFRKKVVKKLKKFCYENI